MSWEWAIIGPAIALAGLYLARVGRRRMRSLIRAGSSGCGGCGDGAAHSTTSVRLTRGGRNIR